MNEEIKVDSRLSCFRVWDKDKEQMIEPALKLNSDGSVTHYNFFDLNDNPLRANYLAYIWLEWTGLFDKNGKKIYEADIVENHHTGERGKIVYEAPEFLIKYDGVITPLDPTSTKMGVSALNGGDSWEVVGDMYRNPEMLRGLGE